MAHRVYRGTAYRQALDADAPWLVSFVATAEDLLSWAGIPRRTDNEMMGFQRAYEESRVERAKKFFQQFGLNQSPTSIVLGIHRPLEGEPVAVSLGFDASSDAEAAIRPCSLTVDLEGEPPLETLRNRLRKQIEARLAEDQADSAGSDEFDDGDGSYAEEEVTAPETAADNEIPAAADGPAPDGESDEVDEDDEEIELGRSLLRNLLLRLDDEIWCTNNSTDLRDLGKPATIIDGQHRVLGAALCEQNIPFSVIALINCSWAEQVFQFTVVNYTAKGIPDQFITANAALSLTANELQLLEERLRQAGVKVIEYELMRVINFDPESPFYELINLTPKKVDVRQIMDTSYP
jgi:hypothetical protein